MIFPKFIREQDTIGVTALSDGVSKELDRKRFANAADKLLEKGYKVAFTNNVFTADAKGRSSEGKVRAKEFHELLLNENIASIFSAKGGNFLVEMLPYLEEKIIRSNPKWIQGYSDNTGLLFYITTKYDIATMYGANFGDFGMDEWHRSVNTNLAILEGNEVAQQSFSFYEDGFGDRITGLEGYTENQPVYWKNLRDEESIEVNGRLIGGCLDVLLNITGTRYDGLLDYIEKYKEDKIVWYLESFDLNAEELMMGLWHLKELGWFNYASGIVFGRPLMFSSFTNTSYEEAILTILDELSIPIILDADIGHKGPQFVMINGALAKIHSKGGKGEVIFSYTE